MDVLDRILRLREERGWTEYKLSVESGITQSTISSWFCKNARPSVQSLEAICKACGITMSQFFAEEGDTPICLSDVQSRLLRSAAHLSVEQQEALIRFLDAYRPKAP